MKGKCTIEKKLIDDGWFENRNEIIPWILARKVLVNNKPVFSISEKVPVEAEIRIKEYYKKKYVSKGGVKLEHALQTFHIKAEGRVALDCGASTGGFTDCLLAFGAEQVYAVDAGFGQLSSKLQHSKRVVNLEKTNISDALLLNLTPKPSLITLDLTYLSLREGLTAAKPLLAKNGEIVALIKPIFETQNQQIRQTGDINHFDLHDEVITNLCDYCESIGLYPAGLTYSPVRGNGGAVEYFLHLTLQKKESIALNQKTIADVITAGLKLDNFTK